MRNDINKILQGDCLEVMKTLPDNSVDAIVTDPPYGLSFMGKRWDYDVPSVEIWKEALRVLKPGGYLLSFAGTRTQHRMACNIEDAGFEIRDMIAWIYGSGFPKSLNIGKAIDKLQGTEYPVNTLVSENSSMSGVITTRHTREIESELGKEWEGWGTALKPALEPITVARKPLSEKSVAENVLKWGTGGINIDGCKVGNEQRTSASASAIFGSAMKKGPESQVIGRWPANLIHDGSSEVIEFLTDNARFFYCAKASKTERNEGLEDMEQVHGSEITGRKVGSAGAKASAFAGVTETPRANIHPTVKPISLMEYLVKLVSKEGALVLDPFTGSGSTLIACRNLGRSYIGIERETDYIKIAEARLKEKQLKLI